jgi:L-seryl-tRNA(Ser) seleniumtransferase
MMSAGEEGIVADRLVAVLSSPPRRGETTVAPPAADLTGQWEVHIDYAAGASKHALFLRQRGNELDGAHQGDFVTRDLSGVVDGDSVLIRSTYTEEHGDALGFAFTGRVSGDEMAGTLDMGEYLRASWTARRGGNGKA